MFYTLNFLKKIIAKSEVTGVCASDLKEGESQEMINLEFVLSVSDLLEFKLPLSGDFVCNYGIITMSNNDKYYIAGNRLKEFVAHGNEKK